MSTVPRFASSSQGLEGETGSRLSGTDDLPAVALTVGEQRRRNADLHTEEERARIPPAAQGEVRPVALQRRGGVLDSVGGVDVARLQGEQAVADALVGEAGASTERVHVACAQGEGAVAPEIEVRALPQGLDREDIGPGEPERDVLRVDRAVEASNARHRNPAEADVDAVTTLGASGAPGTLRARGGRLLECRAHGIGHVGHLALLLELGDVLALRLDLRLEFGEPTFEAGHLLELTTNPGELLLNPIQIGGLGGRGDGNAGEPSDLGAETAHLLAEGGDLGRVARRRRSGTDHRRLAPKLVELEEDDGDLGVDALVVVGTHLPGTGGRGG